MEVASASSTVASSTVASSTAAVAIPSATPVAEEERCETDADCAITTWEGCCQCNCREVYALNKRALKAKEDRCASRRCLAVKCPKCEHSTADWLGLCRQGRCVAHLAPVD
ncbi:MAG: hypothetical protein R3B13_13145 [Polyangiaceae bacterium]